MNTFGTWDVHKNLLWLWLSWKLTEKAMCYLQLQMKLHLLCATKWDISNIKTDFVKPVYYTTSYIICSLVAKVMVPSWLQHATLQGFYPGETWPLQTQQSPITADLGQMLLSTDGPRSWYSSQLKSSMSLAGFKTSAMYSIKKHIHPNWCIHD